MLKAYKVLTFTVEKNLFRVIYLKSLCSFFGNMHFLNQPQFQYCYVICIPMFR